MFRAGDRAGHLVDRKGNAIYVFMIAFFSHQEAPF